MVMDNPLLNEIVAIDDKILDLIDLMRLIFPRFNNTPAEKVIVSLNEAYKANGKLADAIEKGCVPR